eukprot:COSAG01_NODE_2142_length_8319_cov_19.391653_6_plen_91_part_00
MKMWEHLYEKCGNPGGKAQSVLIMIKSIIFTRTRNIHREMSEESQSVLYDEQTSDPGHTVLLTCRRPWERWLHSYNNRRRLCVFANQPRM